MSNPQDFPPQEMPALLRTAIEMHERDRANRQQEEAHEQLSRAAAELGIPGEYLLRASAWLREKREARARRLRRLQAGAMFALGTASGLGTGFMMFGREPMPPPAVVTLQAPPAPVYTKFYYTLGDGRFVITNPVWVVDGQRPGDFLIQP